MRVRSFRLPTITAAVLLLLVFFVLAFRSGKESPTTPPPPPDVPPVATRTEPPAVRMPGEFERQEAVLLAAGTLAESFPETLTAVVKAVGDDVALLGTVNGAEQATKVRDLLIAAEVAPERIRLIRAQSRSRWMRDYGPIFVHLSDGRRAVVDPIFVQKSGAAEDQFAGFFASLLGLSSLAPHIILEGGNVLSNGQGLCLTTSLTLLRNQTPSGSDHHYDEARIRDFFAWCFGSTETVLLEALRGNRSGHVDMFATFTAADTVVVGSYDPAVDPVNAAVLDRNAEKLSGLITSQGPLRVVRIPLVSYCHCTESIHCGIGSRWL